MDDPDIFAYLYPAKGQGSAGALNTIDIKANSSRCLPAQKDSKHLKSVLENDARSVREATEEPEKEYDLELQPCIVLRFSDPPPTGQGAVAGRSPDAFIRLPADKGISWYHFAVTFDKHFHMMVQDLNSTVGTQLIYDDGEEGPPGHGVAWSACGPTFVKKRPPVIKVIDDLQFTLVVPEHDLTSPAYRNNITRYLQGTAAPDDLVSELEIFSRTRTEVPSGGEVQTAPAKILKSSLWKRKLGHGSFGVVSYAWDVTSRAEFALKEPRPKAGGDWEKEARIMKNISHDHIVALKYACFDPTPQLYFEYVPGGSLEHYQSTTSFQRQQIAIQLLDGLRYLHGQSPSIAHRDIKPENVLVQHWSPDKVHVKLADFGLSKQSTDLATFCGTAPYEAPEIFCTRLSKSNDASNYDPLVDIWSLAVLLVKMVCRKLPTYSKSYESAGTTWSKVMLQFVTRYMRSTGDADPLLPFLLENMLVIDPRKRQPAEACHDKALRLFGADVAVPTPERSSSTRECDLSLHSSDNVQNSDGESNLATPRAGPATYASPPEGSGISEATTIRVPLGNGKDGCQSSSSLSRITAPGSASLIRDLGEQGSSFIDSLLGIKPSDLAEFERWSVPVPDNAARPSVVNSELWDPESAAGPYGSVRPGQSGASADSVGSELRRAIQTHVAKVARGEDDPVAASPSKLKRPRLGE